MRAPCTGRLASPVESAAYFAVSELLTNVVRPAGAGRVTVTVEHTRGTLRITVEDDGRGGADAREGGGLAGIRRRLAAFDGTLDAESPAGGPSRMHIVIPCQPANATVGAPGEGITRTGRPSA